MDQIRYKGFLIVSKSNMKFDHSVGVTCAHLGKIIHSFIKGIHPHNSKRQKNKTPLPDTQKISHVVWKILNRRV